ncbi:type II toxin-antitoxin system ParD family antitoxin [Pseudomonas costantinii]|uniref:Antitoxin ParD n=2 Tax=Pseudomonas costantinii TaxID=168469 RepID=A0A1H5HYK4_9PSED|nr:type II toxin-antitoxin system ParD family antitoxin [Pseudomonas costantinii]SEE32999.1 putative addiction module antidote protein, CC2985 family [Pseudomonas costantinii]
METCQSPRPFWSDDETPDIDVEQLLLASRQWSSRIESYSSSADFKMRSTLQMSITLPIEMAALVKAKVAAGEYATESEVIRDGLRALLARDRAMEDWLRDEVIPAAAALKADPGRALSAGQVREHMAAKRQRKGTEKP